MKISSLTGSKVNSYHKRWTEIVSSSQKKCTSGSFHRRGHVINKRFVINFLVENFCIPSFLVKAVQFQYLEAGRHDWRQKSCLGLVYSGF